jgi:hypothetical protein
VTKFGGKVNGSSMLELAELASINIARLHAVARKAQLTFPPNIVRKAIPQSFAKKPLQIARISINHLN